MTFCCSRNIKNILSILTCRSLVLVIFCFLCHVIMLHHLHNSSPVSHLCIVRVLRPLRVVVSWIFFEFIIGIVNRHKNKFLIHSVPLLCFKVSKQFSVSEDIYHKSSIRRGCVKYRCFEKL